MQIYLMQVCNYMLCCRSGGICTHIVISNTQIHQNTVFIKQKDIKLTNDARTVIVNVDLSSYDQTIAKVRDDLIQTQKSKLPFALVHELKHI